MSTCPTGPAAPRRARDRAQDTGRAEVGAPEPVTGHMPGDRLSRAPLCTRGDSEEARAADAEAVSLRPVLPEHAARLAELERRNREELLVGAPLREESWFTEAGQAQAIEQALAAAEAGLGMPFVIALGEGERQRVVGRLSITAIIRGAFQSASLGYWVDRDEWGRGVATQAVRTAIGVAFGGLRLHRLQAEVQVGNDASVRVLERCGFAEYGLAPQYLHLGGRWRDCRLFQLVHAGAEPPEGSV